MRCRIFNATSFVSFLEKTPDLPAMKSLLKRFLYQLRINFLPPIFMLICSSIIALYFSGLIDRAKLRSTELKPAQASHERPGNTQTQAFVKK